MTKEKHKSVRCDIRDARERHGHESGALVLLQDDLGLYRYLSTFPTKSQGQPCRSTGILSTVSLKLSSLNLNSAFRLRKIHIAEVPDV